MGCPNFMNNIAAQVDGMRSSTTAPSGTAFVPAMNVNSIAKGISAATDSDDRRLGLVGRWHARRHSSMEVLQSSKQLSAEREKAIRELVKDSIHAEAQLIRASLKLRFDTKFGVLAQQGLASFAAVQRDLYAVVDAASDCINHDLYERMQQLSTKHTAGHLSDHHFNSQVQRAWAQAERAIGELEASCGRKLDAVKEAFAMPAPQRS